MPPVLPYQLYPMGDSAICIDYGNIMREDINREVLNRFQAIRKSPLPALIEAVPAYSSLTLFFDMAEADKLRPVGKQVFEWLQSQLVARMESPVLHNAAAGERLIRIPVCYDLAYAPDLPALARAKNLTVDEVIAIHSSGSYRVYMLGFLPGFPYMGITDEKIAMPRKSRPVQVVAGSVGIAGRQTGIYPFASPGGWHIIGRTAISLFDKEQPEPTLLRAGDSVRFISISKDEFTDH